MFIDLARRGLLIAYSKCDKSFKSETDAAYATYFRFLCGFSERREEL